MFKSIEIKLSQIISLGIFFVISITSAGASGLDPGLSNLETKFFMHDYGQDTDESRLKRLELLVFGVSRSGSIQDRLSKLQAAVSKNDSPVADATAKQPATSNKQSATSQPSTSNNQIRSTNADSIANSSNYPSVTNIESQYFGTTYVNEPVEKRLDRLELKLFGAVQTGDLISRVDNLKSKTGIDATQQQADNSNDQAEVTDNNKMDTPNNNQEAITSPPSAPAFLPTSPAVSPGAPAFLPATPTSNYSPAGSPSFNSPYDSNSSSTANELPPTAPSYNANQGLPPAAPHTTSMTDSKMQAGITMPPEVMMHTLETLEMQVVGKVYLDSVPNRLTRLELRVFPLERPATDLDFSQRVNRLVGAVGADKSIAQDEK